MLKQELTLETIKEGVRHPLRAFDEVVLQHLYRVPATAINGRWTLGTNVFSREWDMLVLLDTCRVDALEAVASEYDFLEDIGSIRSVGGATPEWIARTFDRKHAETIGNTCYLSGTAQARGILEERLPRRRSFRESHLAYKLLDTYDTVDIGEIGRVEYLFEYEPRGEEGKYGHPEGLTPPRYVTDRGISVGRTMDFERLILHYMQPHSPYVANALSEERELDEHEPRPLRYLRETGDFETVWNAYLDELRYVLDDVELLLENIDAERVVISADHGEAFGEYGIYGHQVGSLHPKIRTVPWGVTTGEDTGSYTPTVEPTRRGDEPTRSTEEILQSLGYKF
jgi:hypothetical protein